MHIDSSSCPGAESYIPLLLFFSFVLTCFFYVKLVNTVKAGNQSGLWFFLGGVNCLLPRYTSKRGTVWRLLFLAALAVCSSTFTLLKMGIVCAG